MELQVSTPGPQAGQNQHCWECRRRQLVCDSTRPVCKKCRLSRIVCPGYDDKQHLRWLAPGKVTFRPRKSKPAAKRKATGDAEKRPDDDDSYGRLDENRVRVITNFEMRTETCTAVKAAHYCKSNPIVNLELGGTSRAPNKREPFPLALIHSFPTSVRHGFVSIAMTHRLYQLPEGTPRDFLLEAQSRNYQYRGMALRALNEEISSEEGGASHGLISSIITILSIDLSLSTIAGWRHHYNAIGAMVKLLGGLKTMYRTNPNTRLTFVTIIVINELRRQAANLAAKAGPSQPTASDLLERIHDFSPGDWIKGKATATSKREWLLIGSAYQSAVALYCIMSLQGLSVLPSALYITAMDAAHYERLMQLLKEALEFPHLRHCLMWPLIVSGARAVYGSADDRKFVDEQLKELSRAGGTALPLTAKAALNRFWASGKTGWDDCFDKPYIFAA
ncbi:hypothetical protein DL766_008738 [Monosporascus sp. MC13-8B]|uniref:Zn(2)-C6 fungal-type domain-containing protein n=1 Tax=Monosporascus cannonballus TaxID=155416 RepID=A0ABY0HFX6_9PEZI|nr:hypothetical protein DL762_001616 [Monosporascus cannonballus]RYP00266.1 hypothetical protein DL763_000877 [Monosporascus cannonballus]RYP18193.1 hypothetical protein DL766_008738 [Monosporascus sp. MC13-8B]